METKSSFSDTSRQTLTKFLPAVFVLLVGALYHPTVGDLYSRWIKWDEGLSHGLIIIFAFFFFLIKESPLQNTSTKGMHILLGSCLALSSIVWFVCRATNIQIAEQLSLILIIGLAFATLFGQQTVRKNALLFGLPIFAIPVWDQLNDLLVSWSSLVVGQLVRSINMPAVIDGNSIFIPSGEIVIADGCSGLRYFTISLAIGYVISYLNGYTGRKLIATLCIAAIIGLITNWLRIFILVIVGNETNMQSPLMTDHEYFGWALFALAAAPAIYFAPVVQQHKPAPINTNPSLLSCILPIAALAIGPTLSTFFDTTPKALPIKPVLDSNYTPILEKRMPLQIFAPTSVRTENAMDQTNVFIQINHYQRSTPDQKLVPYSKRLHNSDQWSIVNEHVKQNGSTKINIKIFRNKHNGIIVSQAQWYVIAGIIVDSYSWAKLLQVPAILSNKNQFSIYSLQSTCSDINCAPEMQNILERTNKLISLIKE